MAETHYALVAYLPGKLGELVDRLRHRFNPELAAWLAHVTILPPRPLQAPLREPLETIRKECASYAPFKVAIREASTFWPVSGVVYLSFSFGRERLVHLHDALSCDGLVQQEIHPYVPHVTVAQELDQDGTQVVLADVARELSHYKADLSFRVESLFLVQHTPENRWINLASIPLGGHAAPSHK